MKVNIAALLSLSFILFPGSATGAEQNWLLITTPELRKSFEPLVRLREADGYHVVEMVDDWQSGKEQIEESVTRILAQIKQTRGSATHTSVLIGGAYNALEKSSFVPTSRGRNGRMRGKATDYYFSLPDDKGRPTVAVGRIPARNRREASAMVEKVIRGSQESLAETAPHLGIIVAHPGGETQLERQFGEAFLQMTVSDRLKQFDPDIRVNVIADIENSKFAEPNQDFSTLTQNVLSGGNMFTVYCGHSSAGGLWSKSGYVLSRDGFAKLSAKGYPGVFVSCGCFTCQTEEDSASRVRIQRKRGEAESILFETQGFGIAAIRNANGPAAVFGPYGESYAIFGKLAVDALQKQFLEHGSTTRVGDYWMAVQREILSGHVDALTFFLFDQADGSRGKTTIATQRSEHIEMWTLLGDPAMSLPPILSEETSISGKANRSNRKRQTQE